MSKKSTQYRYDAGIRTHDQLEHESPPITTRPGLPPLFIFCVAVGHDFTNIVALTCVTR